MPLTSDWFEKPSNLLIKVSVFHFGAKKERLATKHSCAFTVKLRARNERRKRQKLRGLLGFEPQISPDGNNGALLPLSYEPDNNSCLASL
jgi:hypothetical protein